MRKILFSRKLGLSILLAALLVSLLPAAAFAASKDDPYAAMPSFGILTEKATADEV